MKKSLQERMGFPKLLRLPKRPEGEEIKQDDQRLPEEIKAVIWEGNVEKVVYFEKREHEPLFIVHYKNDEGSEFNCFEVFHVEMKENKDKVKFDKFIFE